MTRIAKAISKAKEETALHLTVHLQNHALDHGWKPEVVAGLRVHHVDGSYQISVPEEHKDAAWVHEYGNELTRPTAAVRKYFNNTSDAEHFYMQRLSHHLGGKF